MADMDLHYGINLEIESAADEILARGRDGITKHSLLHDYLSPSQLERRIRKEIYTSNGTPDKGLYEGMAKRVYVPGREKAPRTVTKGRDNDTTNK